MRVVLATFILLAVSFTSFGKDFNAGPIWDNHDASVKCPAVCASVGSQWEQTWVTTVDATMSVCGCKPIYQAGPIWNNEDGKTKCPAVCIAHGQEWDGNWRTTEWGKMSVCQCKD